MKLQVLFGQRKCSYPGQYAIEALACIDDNSHSDNPDYIESEHAKHLRTDEFERLAIVELALSESDVRSALYPELKPITASVVRPQ